MSRRGRRCCKPLLVQQVIHINAPQHIAAADKQPQRGRNDRQVVHFCQQIRKAADHSHMVTFHKSHQRMDVGLILVSGDGQSGTIQQTGEHFLHKDVKRTDGILQHDITGAGDGTRWQRHGHNGKHCGW